MAAEIWPGGLYVAILDYCTPPSIDLHSHVDAMSSARLFCRAAILFLCLGVAAAGQRPCVGQSAAESPGPKISLADLIERTESSCVRLDVISKDGKGIGSGFIVEKPDWVVTNHHVAAGALTATATFADGTKAEVEGFLAYGEKRDVAVLKLKTNKKVTPLKLCQALPRKGESVIAIGAPGGLSFTATEGIISAIRDGAELKAFGTDAVGKWLQTSTPISPGSSGGPLLNLQGEVVGANSGSLASAQNLNFAISAEDIAYVLKAAAASPLRELSKLESIARSSATSPRPRTGPPGRPSAKGEPEEHLVCHLPAQRRFSHRYKITQEEDEFDKVKWLRTQWIPLDHNDRRLTSCGLRVGVPFRENAPPPAVIWEVNTASPNFSFVGPGSRRFQLLVDGESVELPDPVHKGDVGRGSVTETLVTPFRLPAFLRIVAAKEVKARIGSLEYKLSADQLEAFRDLASRLPTGETDDGRVEVKRYDLNEDPTVKASAKKAKPKAVAKGSADAKGSASAAVPATSSAIIGSRSAFRTWISADGKYKVEARLVGFSDGIVELERRDNGQKVRIPVEKLSDADRQFVQKTD
jgi:S1-C subfamily serine protease